MLGFGSEIGLERKQYPNSVRVFYIRILTDSDAVGNCSIDRTIAYRLEFVEICIFTDQFALRKVV